MLKLIKKIFPANAKRSVKVCLRRGKDFFNGSSRRFSTTISKEEGFRPVISIEQAILPATGSANKIHNISLAIEKLNGLLILPGGLFSFWQLVKSPSQKRGFRKSRSIVGGTLSAETGGGLCQLSGLIYFLAIKAGLQVVERHAHSMDIYAEAERFTPLGSDATVAYGYRDLRIKNNLLQPVVLKIELVGNTLTGSICSIENITERNIEFRYRQLPGKTEVTTWCKDVLLAKDIYNLKDSA